MHSGIPDRPFAVDGNNFPDFASAAQRSCDEQFQGCQERANAMGNGNGSGNANGDQQDGGGEGKLTVNMCDQQKGEFDKQKKRAVFGRRARLGADE